MMITPWMNLTLEMTRLGLAAQQQWLRTAMGSHAARQTREAAQAATLTAQQAAGVMLGAGLTPAQAGMLRDALKTYRRHQRRSRQHHSSTQ